MCRSTPSNELKKQGFLDGMGRCYPDQAPLCLEVNHGAEPTIAALREMLAEQRDVDGIVFSDDNMAVAGLRLLADLGRRVPEDVQVVGINNSQFTNLSIPTLTSLDNMLYDISMTAVRHVLALLSGQRVSKKMVISTEIVVRESTRPLNTLEEAQAY